jgi:thiol-disulfide isomerase/thioredoxin
MLPVLPVVEEFTGTWCGYCPYGIVGMQKAHETYGDQVVLIAAHSGDPMECAGYADITNTVSSYPSAFMNRETDFYPSSYTILNEIRSSLNRAVQGKVSLMAMWGDDDKNSVAFGAQSTFVYTDDDARYGIAFVLVEDGMSNKSWAQSNFLSGENDDLEMSFWCKAPSSVYGLEFDHVAVAAWGISNGVKGSVGTTIQAGQPQTFSYNADISSNRLIQDKTKLKAIALLIDQVSGTIINAAQADIQDYSTGIETIAQAEDSSTTTYYTLDGRRIASPQKGLIIEKNADGKSRKILVK